MTEEQLEAMGFNWVGEEDVFKKVEGKPGPGELRNHGRTNVPLYDRMTVQEAVEWDFDKDYKPAVLGDITEFCFADWMEYFRRFWNSNFTDAHTRTSGRIKNLGIELAALEARKDELIFTLVGASVADFQNGGDDPEIFVFDPVNRKMMMSIYKGDFFIGWVENPYDPDRPEALRYVVTAVRVAQAEEQWREEEEGK